MKNETEKTWGKRKNQETRDGQKGDEENRKERKTERKEKRDEGEKKIRKTRDWATRKEKN